MTHSRYSALYTARQFYVAPQRRTIGCKECYDRTGMSAELRNIGAYMFCRREREQCQHHISA